MRKTWVKKEHIYYKPFYKQRFKLILFVTFVFAIVLFCYEVFYINQLPTTSTPLNIDSTWYLRNSFTTEDIQEIEIIKGIRLRDYAAYKPNYSGNFQCISGKQEIAFSKVNDDFCDCEDGTDETSTSACSNGLFYCKFQMRHFTGRGRDISVPSSRINDGICDCCDGSDEWIGTVCEKQC